MYRNSQESLPHIWGTKGRFRGAGSEDIRTTLWNSRASPAFLSQGHPCGPEPALCSLPARPSTNPLDPPIWHSLSTSPHGLAMAKRPTPLFSVSASCSAFPIPKILVLEKTPTHIYRQHNWLPEEKRSGGRVSWIKEVKYMVIQEIKLWVVSIQ